MPDDAQSRTPAALASEWELKEDEHGDWRGPNPFEQGAETDGFVLFQAGNAYDRKLNRSYSPKDVADAAGLRCDEYEPCRKWQEEQDRKKGESPSTEKPRAPANPMEPLLRRGLRKETLSKFKIQFKSDPDRDERGYYYPTFHPDLKEGQSRFKNADKAGNKYRWAWGKDKRRPNGYGLNFLDGTHAYLVGGEPDVWIAQQAGLPAVCTFGENAYKLLAPLMAELVNQGVKTLDIILDNDEAGHAGAIAAHEQAIKAGLDAKVRVLDGPNKFDVGDLYKKLGFDDERFREALGKLPVANALKFDEWKKTPATADTLRQLGGTELVIELMKDCEFFHTFDDVNYASVKIAGHREVLEVESRLFLALMAQRFYDETGGTPQSKFLSEAQLHFSGVARYKNAVRDTHVRVGHREGATYIDLCNDNWEVVKITSDGWSIITDCPIHFRREAGMKALPRPHRDGDLGLLRPFLNAHSDTHWSLMRAWIVGAVHSRGPYAALLLQGEQGTAKSNTSRFLRMVIDPNEALETALPDKDDDLIIQAHNTWVVCISNLSGLKRSKSDILCRIATDGGNRKRKLYENSKEIVYNDKRPIILNGIDEIAGNGDLRSRAITINLSRLPAGERKRESVLEREFLALWPQIFGGLLDTAVVALKHEDTVEVSSDSRLADFVTWVKASEEALPEAERIFEESFESVQAEAEVIAMEASKVAEKIVEYMQNKTQVVTCTMSELYNDLSRLCSMDEKDSPDWPRSMMGLSRGHHSIKRIAPMLRVAHQIEFEQLPPRGGQRLVTLKKIKTEAT